MLTFIYLLISALAGGLIAGLTGIGTGFILIVVIPICLSHMGIAESELVKLTIANTIFATMCSSLVNNVTVILRQQFFVRETFITALAAAITAALMLNFVVYRIHYPREIYNMVIIVLLTYVIIRTIYKLRKSYRHDEASTGIKLMATGMAGGTVAAFTGLGGGSILMPLFNLWLKMDIRKAKTVAYGTIFTIATVLTIINLLTTPQHPLQHPHVGLVILPVVLPLTLGIIISSPLGVLLSEKISQRTITYLFLSVLTLVIFRKLFELM